MRKVVKDTGVKRHLSSNTVGSLQSAVSRGEPCVRPLHEQTSLSLLVRRLQKIFDPRWEKIVITYPGMV